jgi:hypothetical protein
MTPEEFVAQIRSAVVGQNIVIYKDIFETTSPADASDMYWKRALTLYNSLGGQDRYLFFEIVRQIMVDTISNLFGILDGVSSLGGISEDFILTSKSDGLKINGDLQDIYLALENGK